MSLGTTALAIAFRAILLHLRGTPILGIPAPVMVNAPQKPSEGVTMTYTFDKANANALSTHNIQSSRLIETALISRSKNGLPPCWRRRKMRVPLGVFGILATLAATGVSAQPLTLTGQYRCVQGCLLGHVGWPAYITQNGGAINVLNEADIPSRAWFRWGGTRIWAPGYHQGAVISPDARVIQWDSGTIWRRTR